MRYMPQLFAVEQGAVVGGSVIHTSYVLLVARLEIEHPIVPRNLILRFVPLDLHRSKSVGHFLEGFLPD